MHVTIADCHYQYDSRHRDGREFDEKSDTWTNHIVRLEQFLIQNDIIAPEVG